MSECSKLTLKLKVTIFFRILKEFFVNTYQNITTLYLDKDGNIKSGGQIALNFTDLLK